MIVRIGRILPESYRCGDGRVCQGHLNCSDAVIKETGIADIVCQLTTQFRTGQKIVLNSAGVGEIGKVCLVEDIMAPGCVVISSKCSPGLISRYRAGHVVLIRPVVITEHGTVSNVQPAYLVIEAS